jgi:hypothetical protein
LEQRVAQVRLRSGAPDRLVFYSCTSCFTLRPAPAQLFLRWLEAVNAWLVHRELVSKRVARASRRRLLRHLALALSRPFHAQGRRESRTCIRLAPAISIEFPETNFSATGLT